MSTRFNLKPRVVQTRHETVARLYLASSGMWATRTDYYPRFPASAAPPRRLGDDVRKLEQGGLPDRCQPDVRRYAAGSMEESRTRCVGPAGFTSCWILRSVGRPEARRIQSRSATSRASTTTRPTAPLFENTAQGICYAAIPKLLISTCRSLRASSGPYHKNVATVKGLEALYDVINVHSYAEAEGYPTWRRAILGDSCWNSCPRSHEVIS